MIVREKWRNKYLLILFIWTTHYFEISKSRLTFLMNITTTMRVKCILLHTSQEGKPYIFSAFFGLTILRIATKNGIINTKFKKFMRLKPDMCLMWQYWMMSRGACLVVFVLLTCFRVVSSTCDKGKIIDWIYIIKYMLANQTKISNFKCNSIERLLSFCRYTL